MSAWIHKKFFETREQKAERKALELHQANFALHKKNFRSTILLINQAYLDQQAASYLCRKLNQAYCNHNFCVTRTPRHNFTPKAMKPSMLDEYWYPDPEQVITTPSNNMPPL